MYAEDTGTPICSSTKEYLIRIPQCYQRKVESALYGKKLRISPYQHHLHQKFHLNHLLGPIGLIMTALKDKNCMKQWL